MPELQEVETIVKDLNKKVLNRTIIDVWSDTKKLIKKPKSFEDFEKEIKNKKILKVWRRAKNIIFDLSDGYALLIHLKMTGHLLYGQWKLNNGIMEPVGDEIFKEKVNSYIHLLFYLDNKEMLAFSDLRKFGKAELWKKEDLLSSEEFKKIGPEPLEKDFTLEKFKEVLKDEKGKIKQVLMDPNVIAGIGNIYSDDILWEAKVHPERKVGTLDEKELEKIFKAIKDILQKAVELRGTSISDYRDTSGQQGEYGKQRKIYQREGEKCHRCGTIIKRIKVGGRSSCFCPNCQK